MRKYLALILLVSACTEVPSSGPNFDSVRERLTTQSTWLFVHDEASTGSITARRRVGEAWNGGTTELKIERGYVQLSMNDSGALAIDRLAFDLGAIELGLFEKPAELQDVQVRLAEPVHADVVWRSDDEAIAVMPMPFAFDWAIKFSDEEQAYPLATQKLPATNVAISLGGNGDQVSARIDIDASGELWNWADVLQMTDISVSLEASTADSARY
jgi:hypothetical protein